MKQKADAHKKEWNINYLFAYINLNVVAQGSSWFYDHNLNVVAQGALTGNVHWNDDYSLNLFLLFSTAYVWKWLEKKKEVK